MSRAIPPVPASPLTKAKNRTNTLMSIFQGGQHMFKTGKQFYHDHFEYSVTIRETDNLYHEVAAWLLRELPTEKNRALEVKSSNGPGEAVAADRAQDYKTKPLVVTFNQSVARPLKIKGYDTKVTIIIPEKSDGGYGEFGYSSKINPKKIEFVTRTSAGQKAVIEKLEEINQGRSTSRKAVLKMVGKWDDWRTRSDLPPRTMDSVSLPAEQKERITKDLATFLEAEEQYNRLAIPWHRGYMFHGPPGTGKTSLVKALANEFNLDLWYVSLSDLSKESSLLQLLAEVGPRSLLLLEDIDTMEITHDRDSSEQGKISMGSLLNTLDGVATPHGLITMMTTNRFDILDPALTRSGRMDLVEELTWPTRTVISDMYMHFYGKRSTFWNNLSNGDAPYEGISTSQVAEVMKRHMTDPSGARKAIENLLRGE